MRHRTCLEELFNCLVRFGHKRTNPVLEILKDSPVLESHRYPPERLRFGHGLWRAFYHCHDSPRRNVGEHGHFHIFARPGEKADDWTHVAGLAMDHVGQPSQWFAANQWVTGGLWLPAAELARALTCPRPSAESNLVEQWLAAMVCAYKDEILQMLEDRDRALSRHAAGRRITEVLKDRSIYQLANHTINLQKTLEDGLAGPVAGKAGADQLGIA